MMLKRLRHDVLYRGKVFDLVVDQVEYPSGTRSIREVARHPGGAVAVPVFDDGSLLLVGQYRYPVGKEILEFPAGKLSPGEDPLVCAQRELEEETGWRAAQWEKLGSIITAPGFSDEALHLYHATGLTENRSGPDRSEGEEGMTLHRISRGKLEQMICDGTITDAKTICALFYLQARGEGGRS